MALQVAPFQPFELVLKRLIELGCEIRQLDGNLVGPYGETVTVRYAVNPSTNEFYYLDYEDGDSVAPSAIESIERRLSLKLGFPMQTVFDDIKTLN